MTINIFKNIKTICITYDGVFVLSATAKVSKVEMAELHVLWAWNVGVTGRGCGCGGFRAGDTGHGRKMCERGEG